MVLVIRIERLSQRLAGIEALVRAYAQGEPSFDQQVIDWLTAAEAEMRELRLRDSSELVQLRTRVLAAGEPSPGQPSLSRSDRRRAHHAVAAAALERAEELLRTHILTAEAKLAAAEERLIGALTSALVRQVLPLPPTSPRLTWYRRVWDTLAADPETRADAVWLASTLSAADRLPLLDTVLSRLTSLDLPVLPLEALAPAARPWAVIEIEGIGKAWAARLRQEGILDTAELIEALAAPAERAALAGRLGLSEDTLLRWGNMATLLQVPGLGPDHAELLVKLGITTLELLAGLPVAQTHAALVTVNERHNLVAAVPPAEVVWDWIHGAQMLLAARGLASPP